MKGEDLVLGEKRPTVRPCAFKVVVARCVHVRDARYMSSKPDTCTPHPFKCRVACSLSVWKHDREGDPYHIVAC